MRIAAQIALLLMLCSSVGFVAASPDTKLPAATAPAKNAPKGWRQVTMDELTLSMPASAKSLGGDEVTTHWWAAVQGDSALFALTLSRKTMKPIASDEVLLKTAYKSVVQSLLDADLLPKDAAGKANRVLKSEQPLTLTGHTGREWVETVQGMPLKCRGYASNRNFYFALCLNSTDANQSSTFLDSISFADKDGAANP